MGLIKRLFAINFNLYEDEEDTWTIEMIGASKFDENDEDWACNEVYNNREKAFSWKEKESWKTIQSEIEVILIQYLQSGKKAEILKRYVALA